MIIIALKINACNNEWNFSFTITTSWTACGCDSLFVTAKHYFAWIRANELARFHLFLPSRNKHSLWIGALISIAFSASLWTVSGHSRFSASILFIFPSPFASTVIPVGDWVNCISWKSVLMGTSIKWVTYTYLLLITILSSESTHSDGDATGNAAGSCVLKVGDISHTSWPIADQHWLSFQSQQLLLIPIAKHADCVYLFLRMLPRHSNLHPMEVLG